MAKDEGKGDPAGIPPGSCREVHADVARDEPEILYPPRTASTCWKIQSFPSAFAGEAAVGIGAEIVIRLLPHALYATGRGR
jgi:hypothetical protein